MRSILNKREKILFEIAIAAIIFGFVFNIFLWPVLNKNYILNKEIGLTRIKLKRYLGLLKQKDYLENKYRDFSAISGTREDATLAGLSELEGIAKASDIRIIDIRPQTQKGSGLHQENLIDFRTEGTMESYIRFIYTIENSPSLLRIKKFQLNAKPNTSTLDGSFSISQIPLP